MSLAAPEWLALLWLTLPLVALLWWASRRRRADLERLIAAGLLGQHVPAGLEGRRAWRSTLLILGLALAVFAAAQPRWGFTWRELETEGVEVIVALDLSRSMNAEDIAPSRLDRARREVADLLDALRGDKVGMVIFAAGAYPRVPLTVDFDALMGILEHTDAEVLRAQGSSIASALRESLQLFGEEAGVDRAVVLISDGEAWDPDLAEAAEQLSEAGVRVYAVGVGTEGGAPIPEPGGGFKADRGGEIVISRLNEDALKRVAAITGGAYVRSVAGGADVRELVGEMRSVMARTATDSRREKVWDERFQVPLAAGLGLILLASLLGDGRGALVLVVLLSAGVARAAEPEALLRQAREGDPAEAVEALSREQAADPSDPWAQWALAEALYRAGRFDDAASSFEELARRAPDPAMQRDALYNAGNARYRAGRLDDAVQDWEQVLAGDPEHAAAKSNAEAVRQEIARRVQQQSEQQPQDGEQGGEPQEGDQQGGQPQGDQPQGGQPQEGQAQEGQQGEPQTGDEPQSGDEPQAGDGTREAREPSPGTEPQGGAAEPQGGQEDPSAAAAQGQEGEPDDTGTAGAAEGAPPEGVEPMSPQEAQRLLDGVEEGRPRVVAGGQSQEKDW